MTVLPPPVPPPVPPLPPVPQAGHGEPAGATVGPDTAEARHDLSVPWRWIMAIGWSVVMGALGAIAQSAFLADSGPFWLAVKPLPFFLPVLALLALVGNWRRTLLVSAVAAVGTVAIAGGDLLAGYAPVAVTELVCGASALVLTLAGALSRPRSATTPAPPASSLSPSSAPSPSPSPSPSASSAS